MNVGNWSLRAAEHLCILVVCVCPVMPFEKTAVITFNNKMAQRLNWIFYDYWRFSDFTCSVLFFFLYKYCVVRDVISAFEEV